MRFLIVVLITICTFQLSAQITYLSSSKTYTTKDGLSSNRIHAIHKDARGFMWIGTENGLNHFDGQIFEVYTSISHPKMNIERIEVIAEDGAGYLWLLERNEPFERRYASPEINLFNIYTGEFTTLEERFGKDLPFEVKDIWHMQQLSDGSIFIYVCLQQKAYFYTEQKGFIAMPIPKKMGLIGDVEILPNNHILIEGAFSDHNTKNIRWSIFKFNRKGEVLVERPSQLVIPIKDKNQTTYWDLEENRQKMSSALLDAIQVFDSKMNITYLKSNTSVEPIEHTAWNKHQQLLWLKSQQKISVIQPSGKVVYERQVNMDLGELPIFFDGTTTWLSDKQQGLIVITLQPNYFKTYQFFDNEYHNSARGIFAHTNGQKWFSTFVGIKKLDVNNQSPSVILDPVTTPFLKGQSNLLWSFDKGIVSSENLNTHQKQYYPHEPHHLNIWSLYQSESGEIWNFGLTGELFILNPMEAKWRKQSKLPVVVEEGHEFNAYHIQKKDAQSIWVCTNHGLFVVDNEGNYIAQYGNHQKGEFYLPTIDFHHLHEDSEGVIWLATGDGGLISWQLTVGSQQSNFEQYTIEDGLSCNALHAIYEDDYEYLWISSNEGLMQMDKQTKKVVIYTTENGLLHNEFNRISHFQAENGTTYFGGVTGVISFHPKHFSKVRHQKNTAELVVTNFQQFSGQHGKFEDLTYQLLDNSTIRLEPTDRFFKLNLALLNYEDGTTFHYRIKGLYDWQKTTDNKLSISGLPYGENQLEIKAFNAQQQEAANILTFPIEVLRPFYLQWWFAILILGSLILGVFSFIKWRTRHLIDKQEAEQLRTMDKMKSRFFANISHELRTPITLILAPLSQFIKNNDLSNEQKKQLTSIQHNGQNLLNLVNEVLDLSKLEAGKLKLNLSPTKIPDFIERIVANFESAAKTKNIEFQFMSFLQKEFTAQFDKPKLEKILNNLLSNALKFTPKEGTIQVMIAQIEEQLIIKIKDSGRGIAAEDLPHIFERYFQVNEKLEGGTGIGLALTKELVELMDGEILVQSENGKGTEFEVRLPIASCELRVTGYELPLDSVESPVDMYQFKEEPNTSIEKDTILLVEDNQSLQQFIQSILSPKYNVIVTNNGVEALTQLATRNPQLVLSDVMMPEMDGFTLLEKVKSDDRFCSIPFILLTARADMEDKLRGLRIGVDDYMTKPFEVDELLLRIKNLITNAKNREVIIEEDFPPNQTNPNEKDDKKEQTDNVSPSSESTIDRPPSTSDLEWLEKVENIIKKELRNKQFTIEVLAHQVFISRRQFGRKIKRVTGLSPSNYIRNIRLQAARTILEKEENYTISEVSYAVGFENVSYFSKIYEETYGKHPQEYLVKV